MSPTGAHLEQTCVTEKIREVEELSERIGDDFVQSQGFILVFSFLEIYTSRELDVSVVQSMKFIRILN